MLLWNSNHPNWDFDISALVEQKIEALTAHATQFPDPEGFAAFSRERWRGEDGRYLERFRKIALSF